MNRTIHQAPDTPKGLEATPVLTPTPVGNLAGTPYRPAAFGSLCEALDYASEGVTGFNFHGPAGELRAVLGYADLRRAARARAAKLRALGLPPGERVAIVADMTPDFIIGFFACQYAGLLAVPLPKPTGLGGRDSYDRQLGQVLDNSGARLILHAPELTETVTRVAADRRRTAGAPHCLTHDGLDAMAAAPGGLAPLGPADPSHIQYSSGSTSAPAGILISQASMMANAAATLRYGLKVREGDRLVSWLPFYHDMGLIGHLLIPLCAQMSVDYLDTDDFARRPLKWLELISARRATISFSPTFGYEVCVRRARRARALDLDLSCLRAAGIGGEMIRADALDAFAETFAPHGFDRAAFLPSYGLAECTLAFSFPELGRGLVSDRVERAPLIDGALAHKAAPDSDEVALFARTGRPLPGHEVEIRGADDGPLGERRVGRICIKGPSLMDGYFNAPDKTARVRDARGFLDTGDLGYMADGELVITGRQKDLIIVNGRNIWPQDLEWHAAEAEPGLQPRDMAAFGVSEADGREEAVLLVQCRRRDEEARARLAEAVAAAVFRGSGVNCKVVLIPPRSLPFTTSGKLSRARARQLYLEGAFTESGAGRGNNTQGNGAQADELAQRGGGGDAARGRRMAAAPAGS